MMKIPGILKDLTFVAFFIIMMTVVGWACSTTGILGNNPPVTMHFEYMVQVIDQNGTPVPDQKVFFISCLQKPAGWTTPTTYPYNYSQDGFTDKQGFVIVETINYTLTKNDIVWLGTSTNKTLLESDFANKSFNPGSIGKWTRFDYSNVSRGPPAKGYASTIVIRNSDGKMIDLNQFIQEHGFYFSPSRPIDYFAYEDNHSWSS